MAHPPRICHSRESGNPGPGSRVKPGMTKMVLLPHLLIGAAIGLRVHNFWAVFVLSLVSHFIADRIPHWDYIDEQIGDMNKKEFVVFLYKAAADAGIGGALLLALLWQQNAWLYALFGALISILPDFLVFLRKFFPETKWLLSYQKVHDSNHLDQKSGSKIIFPLISELIIAAAAIFFLL